MTENTIENEIWKDVKGYEGRYQVSNLSRIKSLERVQQYIRSGNIVSRLKREKVLTVCFFRLGYSYVNLCDPENGCLKKSIHRLVAAAFIKNPDNKPFVNHIDGDKNNNMIHNLEWVTAKENTDHAIRMGLRDTVGESSPSSKLTGKEVLKIRELNDGGASGAQLAREYKMGETAIYYILQRRTWKHL